ncbi:MAG TPA: FtsX-like permease family protein [Geminicoccaceae bacterium]
MSELRTAAAFARRELRGGARGFVVFIACLALGVAAIAAVGLISAGIRAGVERDSAALLGGDLEIDSVHAPLPVAELQRIVPEGARLNRTIRTNVMASSGGERVVSQLKAVDDAWPLYGEVRLDPPIPIEAALRDGGTAVERGLLTRLDLEIGDPVTIGEAEFEIRAVVEREPDRLSGFFSIGPRLLVAIDQVERTRAIQPGSLARYEYRVALPEGSDAEAVVAAIQAANPDASWRVRSSESVQPRVARFTGRLASYLTIAGLTALLIGGVGIALAVQNYLAGKTATIATLKCLGAPSRLVFRIYLLQVMALTTLGVGLGLVLGQAAPLLMQLVPDRLLTVPVIQGFYPVPLLIAAASGYLAALAFAVWPLARARDTSAAGMFRSLLDGGRGRPAVRDVVWLVVTLGAFAGLAVLAVEDRKLALVFVGVAFTTALVLAGLAQILLLAVGRLGERATGPVRLALANLRRPGAGARGVVAALGAGLAVLTMVGLLQHNLQTELRENVPERAPAFFFIDIQPDQRARFEAIVDRTEGASIIEQAPMVRGRVIRIDGGPVVEEAIRQGVRWTVRHDRGLTFRGEPPDDLELVQGQWWPADYDGPALVSIDEEVAQGYGVGLGDTLSFSVLGRTIEAEIASTREIAWEEGGMNFLFIFSPGVLEQAPHTWLATVESPAVQDGELVAAVTSALPNVTPISVRAIVAQLGDALRKIGLAIGAVAGVTLLSGMLVLAGAIAAARRRHLYESVVLKVLGARRRDLLRLFLLEYLALGLVAGIAGGLLGTVGAAIVVVLVMELGWSFSSGTVLVVVALALALILSAGFTGTWRLLGRPAAPVLRSA